MSEARYPMLQIDLSKLRNNVEQVVSRCQAAGIQVSGVIKGCDGIPQAAAQFRKGGCKWIASSRLEQLEGARDFGIEGPFMAIRVSMLSEVPRLVQIADYSLQSELAVIEAIDNECAKTGKIHNVVVMLDLGDLREGFQDLEEAKAVCVHIEKNLKHVTLAGIGTNLGCYGSIKPTVEKMEEVVSAAELIEEAIGRKLEIISGGATSSFAMVHDGTMPERINHLRIGEEILLAHDLKEFWGYKDMDYLVSDAFTIKAEVIEVKDKPSYPRGEIFIDAFGNMPEYTDRGIRRRALLAIGKVDLCEQEKLLPKLSGIEVLGGSSDHTILDIEDNKDAIKVGDILEFNCVYTTMLFAASSGNVSVHCVNE